MKTLILLLAIALIGFNANAQQQQRYQYQSPEAAYYDAFNRSTQRLYKNTQFVDRAARAVMQGSRNIPRMGPIRNVYNTTRNAVRRTVTLPRYYQYSNGRNNRR